MTSTRQTRRAVRVVRRCCNFSNIPNAAVAHVSRFVTHHRQSVATARRIPVSVGSRGNSGPSGRTGQGIGEGEGWRKTRVFTQENSTSPHDSAITEAAVMSGPAIKTSINFENDDNNNKWSTDRCGLLPADCYNNTMTTVGRENAAHTHRVNQTALYRPPL